MFHLVVNAYEDQSFGNSEADRFALNRSFRDMAAWLNTVQDVSQWATRSAFTVETKELPYGRDSTITGVKVGHIHYVPAPELHAEPSPRDAAGLEM